MKLSLTAKCDETFRRIMGPRPFDSEREPDAALYDFLGRQWDRDRGLFRTAWSAALAQQADEVHELQASLDAMNNPELLARLDQARALAQQAQSELPTREAVLDAMQGLPRLAVDRVMAFFAPKETTRCCCGKHAATYQPKFPQNHSLYFCVKLA